jgi:hypothetical protein
MAGDASKVALSANLVTFVPMRHDNPPIFSDAVNELNVIPGLGNTRVYHPHLLVNFNSFPGLNGN